MTIYISIIIPVFNCWSMTERCLRSLAASCSDAEKDVLEVIVVDNASTDDSFCACPTLGTSLFPGHFQYLRQANNRNFAPACNIGAQAAHGNYLFFLNNDTFFDQPAWLPRLLEPFHLFHSTGMTAPTLLYPELAGYPDRVQHIGIAFEPQCYPVHIFEGFPAKHPAVLQSRSYQALTGAALMVPRQLFLTLGMFDEAFINGGEDVDFGLRLHDAGFSTLHVPEARIYHLCGQTQGCHDYERHNVRLLKQKCLSLIVPDLHKLVASHGYALTLAPNLKIHLLPTPGKKALLACHAPDQQDMEALESFLDQEPLWQAGYEQVIHAHLKMGDHQGAANTLSLAFKLLPTLELATRMTKLAEHGVSMPNLNDAVMLLAWFRYFPFDYVYDSAFFMQQFISKMKKKHKDHFHSLSRLYSNWLENSCLFQQNYFGQNTPYSIALSRYEVWTGHVVENNFVDQQDNYYGRF